jgi:hypothetical protein
MKRILISVWSHKEDKSKGCPQHDNGDLESMRKRRKKARVVGFSIAPRVLTMPRRLLYVWGQSPQPHRGNCWVSGYNFHFFAGSLFIKTMTL